MHIGCSIRAIACKWFVAKHKNRAHRMTTNRPGWLRRGNTYFSSTYMYFKVLHMHNSHTQSIQPVQNHVGRHNKRPHRKRKKLIASKWRARFTFRMRSLFVDSNTPLRWPGAYAWDGGMNSYRETANSKENRMLTRRREESSMAYTRMMTMNTGQEGRD